MRNLGTNTTRPTHDQVIEFFFKANDNYRSFLVRKASKSRNSDSNIYSKSNNTIALMIIPCIVCQKIL